MRRSEILALQKKDIDFKKKKIIVNKSLCGFNKKDLYIKETKSSKIRIIDVDLKLTIILFSYTFKMKNEDYLFKIQPTMLSNTFCSILAKSKLQHIRFHDLRHIHASLLLTNSKNKAITLKLVQERLRTLGY